MLRYPFALRKIGISLMVAAGLAFGFVATTATARAGDDGYGQVTSVPTGSPATHTGITCTYAGGSTLTPLGGGGPPFTNPNTTHFSFDISWVAQARGEYLLADRSHGFPTRNTEGGMLTNPTSGDLLVINTDDPGAGFTTILPPRNDPFAGHRCDMNGKFGGVGTRNEIEGPNGVFTVNDTQAWVGDGPSWFTPGQTDSPSNYETDPCDSSVRVFSLVTGRQIDHINDHGCFRTDEGVFDPVDQVALFANPSEKGSVAALDPHARRPLDNSPFITLISTRSNGIEGDHSNGHGNHFRILKQINFDGNHGTVDADGGIEQAVYSRRTGYIYIAIPGTSENPDGYVTVVDPRPGHLDVVGNYALKAGSCPGGPAGAALGPNYELLLGCGGASPNPGEVVVNTFSLARLAHSTANPIILADGSESCDEVAYDAETGHFGGACFTSKPGLFNLLVNDAHTVVSNPTSAFDTAIPVAYGAHSIAADSVTGTFWMPGSEGTNVFVNVYGPTHTDWVE